ncbi:MAG: hypothetical protein HYR56_02230 [Acidobacteria bacterium]|nr:hypothetical protein [Acidobacteriota bacterium]MBI3421328.1 hypothetical protein [Acidobacteriota bacterium]
MLDVEERSLLVRINEYRAARGLSQLRVSYSLTRCAEWMSGDMAHKNYLSHTDSARRDPFARMSAFSYGYKGSRGENLAAGYNDGSRIFELWKGSPEHHKLMLDPAYRVIGIARAYDPESQLRWYWAADFGSYVDGTMEVPLHYVMNVATVNAATQSNTVAPESIAIASGEGLSACTVVANTLPLPTSLCGTSVTVNGKVARLYSVAPAQIHYVVPADTQPGSATVEILNSDKLIASGSVNVERVSPGLFAIVNDGRMRANESAQRSAYYPFASLADSNTRALDANKSPKSIEDEQRQLVLYGTGLRNCSNIKNVEVRVNGTPVKVRYVGAQAGSYGLDQLNIELPKELQQQEMLQVGLWVEGREANPVSVKVVPKT